MTVEMKYETLSSMEKDQKTKSYLSISVEATVTGEESDLVLAELSSEVRKLLVR